MHLEIAHAEQRLARPLIYANRLDGLRLRSQKENSIHNLILSHFHDSKIDLLFNPQSSLLSYTLSTKKRVLSFDIL